ncbi:MAG: IS66 family transposase [Candidatus Binataceae bacterium]
MSPEAPLDDRSREELIALIRELVRQNAELRAEIEQLKRSQHRQAAPFSKNQPKANPKKPGRKRGQGVFARRPAPEMSEAETVTAQVPLCCPACGGPLDQIREEEATTTDLPLNPRPVVTAYRVPVCRCRQCGKRVRGTAPGLASDQAGATAHRLGPGVMAVAHALHYGIGVPVRKVPAILQELAGVALTQSALTQDALRRAEGRVGVVYRGLRGAVREAPVAHTDDTGWRIGGRTAFLMGFDTDQSTVYQIRFQHRNEEVREIIPTDYGGVLVSDRGKSYDAHAFDEVAQQKCVAHLLRNVTEVVESKRGPGRQFGNTLNLLLRDGVKLWHARSHLTPEAYQTGYRQLDEKLTHHLRNRILRDDDNQRLLNGIGTQHDRGHLLRFLKTEGVEPTNNRAERILRPAVIARKVSHCSKNQRGADAFAAFVSFAQTARKTLHQPLSRSFRDLFSSAASTVTR